MQLNEEQAAGFEAAVEAIAAGRREFTLVGAAGTGKTTMMQHLYERGGDIEFVTPTNKAAQVLRSKSVPANTLYKTFFTVQKEKGKRPTFTPNHELRSLGPDKRDFADVIVCDEASMITTWVVGHLKKMCNTLILVGDTNQLPPVSDPRNPVGYFNALPADVLLTKVMRQGEGSLILSLANAIRSDSGAVPRALQHFAPQTSFERMVADELPKCIAFTNRERQRINFLIRHQLGMGDVFPKVGDIMVCRSNSSDLLLNGTELRVYDFKWDGKSPEAWITASVMGEEKVWTTVMDMRYFFTDQLVSQTSTYRDAFFDNPKWEAEEGTPQLTYGYCITAHTSQGGEWNSVVVFDQRPLIVKMQRENPGPLSPDEYARRWLYTAITRARKELIVAPTWWAGAAQAAAA